MDCVICKTPITKDKPSASDVGIGGWYHEACWGSQDDPCDETDCTWCGGDGWQESDDPLWDDADEVPCSACNGTGLRKHQSIF